MIEASAIVILALISLGVGVSLRLAQIREERTNPSCFKANWVSSGVTLLISWASVSLVIFRIMK
ncbi:MAG: hypothetical protein KW793_01860 [Candidatus Doudnabacteria bacterium]|nr:hypothetical protein [Candidatus Doudnabacteria bacterium]